MTTAREKGAIAEEYAAKKLKSMGYEIVARNFNTRFGEVDIIAKEGECLVFVEVRCRASERFGTPAETVGQRKRQRLSLAASEYLRQNELDIPARFDVFEILGDVFGGRLKAQRFEVYKDAF